MQMGSLMSVDAERTEEKGIFLVVILLSHKNRFHKCIQHFYNLYKVIYNEEVDFFLLLVKK